MIDKTPVEVYDAVAEYVGANEFIKPKYYSYFKEWITEYYALYRVWTFTWPDDFVKDMTTRGPFSATSSLRAVKRLINSTEANSDETVITKFSGSGFSPYTFLTYGIRNNASLSDADRHFYQEVIDENKFQEEIIVTKIIPSTVKVLDNEQLGIF